MKRHRNTKSILTAVIISAVALSMAGCAPTVLPPSQHAPGVASNVRLYETQPAKYEVLGMIAVTITPEMKWDDRGNSTPAFDALKAKAAALGANGILFVPQPGTYDEVATAGYQGKFYQVPLKRNPNTAIGQAIFVVTN